MSDLFNIYEDNLNIAVNRINKIIDTFKNLSKGIIRIKYIILFNQKKRNRQ